MRQITGPTPGWLPTTARLRPRSRSALHEAAHRDAHRAFAVAEQRLADPVVLVAEQQGEPRNVRQVWRGEFALGCVATSSKPRSSKWRAAPSGVLWSCTSSQRSVPLVMRRAIMNDSTRATTCTVGTPKASQLRITAEPLCGSCGASSNTVTLSKRWSITDWIRARRSSLASGASVSITLSAVTPGSTALLANSQPARRRLLHSRVS